jgi:hypothetical protein
MDGESEEAFDYNKLAAAMRPKGRERLWSVYLLPMLKYGTLILAGVWTVYLYYSSQHERDNLDLQLLKAQTSQIDVQRLIAQLALAQNKIALSKSQLDITKQVNGQMEITNDLKIKHFGRDSKTGLERYALDYEYTITNRSDSPREVTCLTFEAFIASLPQIKESNAVVVSDPLGGGALGSLAWRPLDARAYYNGRGAKQVTSFQLPQAVVKPTPGGDTKPLSSGESTSGSLYLILAGVPDDCVEVIQHIGTDGGPSLQDKWTVLQGGCLFESQDVSR